MTCQRGQLQMPAFSQMTDCLLYRPVTVKADTDTLQRDLDALISWEEDWQMAFHPEKCVVIQVTNKRNPITANYTIHGHRLDVVDSSKYLGVTISKDLRWDNHINNVTAKANKTLGFIGRNMRGCKTSARSAAYQEKKKEIWPSPMTKTPYTNRKFENQRTTHRRHQKLRLHNDCGPT